MNIKRLQITITVMLIFSIALPLSGMMPTAQSASSSARALQFNQVAVRLGALASTTRERLYLNTFPPCHSPHRRC
jgi:hypothetical protein